MVEQMKQLLQPIAHKLKFAGNQNLLTVTETLIELQELRHRADYDLGAVFSRPQATNAVARCGNAIKAWKRFKESNTEAAKFFLVCILLWAGLDNRGS